MNFINYACTFPTIRTGICSALGYCTADYVGMSPLQGAATAGLIDKAFEFLIPSNKISEEEQVKTINNTVTQLTGIGLGSIIADGLFPGSSLTSSLFTTLPKFACILTTSKFIQYVTASKTAQTISKVIPLPGPSIIRHNLIRYPIQAISSIFAINLLENTLSTIQDDRYREGAIFVYFLGAASAVAISDIAYPILSSFLASENEESYDIQRRVNFRDKVHKSPTPSEPTTLKFIDTTNP
jgi:hypothetical protein